MKNSDKKVRVSPTVESFFVGEEPQFGNKLTELPLTRCLSWYSNQKSWEDSKKYTIDYAKNMKLDKKVLDKLNQSPDDLFKNLGFVCRMTQRGASLNREDWILNRIKEIVDFDIDSIKVSEFSAKPKQEKTIQDRLYDICSNYISEIEDQVDLFIKTKRKVEFDCYNWMLANNVKGLHAKQIKDHFTPMLKELHSVINKTDDDLVEGYSTYNKRQIKMFYDMIESIIGDCDKLSHNTKISRTPKKKKKVSVEKKVAKVQYKKDDSEYKLVSISPVSILGASQLWVFNTRYKKLGCYIAKDDSGLSIKGTTLEGYDETLSIQKTLRKPLDVLENVVKAKKLEFNRIMKEISTKEQELTGRLNGDTILIKVIK